MTSAPPSIRPTLPTYRVRCRELHKDEQLIPVNAVIVITGAQAAGKTTLARRLANRLGYAVIDTCSDHIFQLAASQALKERPRGLIVETNDVEKLPQVEALVNGPPLHIHLRRVVVGERMTRIFDTIGDPLATNIVNAGRAENMEADALAWLAGLGVAPAAVSPAAASPEAI